MTTPDRFPAFPARRPRIAAIGLAHWDKTVAFDTFPSPEQWVSAPTRCSTLGGSAALSAAILARLGAATSLHALIGDDENGRALVTELNKLGVDSSQVSKATRQRTKSNTISITGDPPGRTLFVDLGAHLALGSRIDIAALFANDVVLLDVDDAPLRRFLLDLPAHTLPTARLLGPLTYLKDPAIPDRFDLLMRHDVAVGNALQFKRITATNDIEGAVRAIQTRMRGENLRAAIVNFGPEGSLAFTSDARWHAPAVPGSSIDWRSAGDGFTGAVAFGMACHWEWPLVLRFANAVEALAAQGHGVPPTCPSWDETITFMAGHETNMT